MVYVYLPSSLVDRPIVWNEIVDLKMRSPVGEWCVVGDFNSMTSLEEHHGSSSQLQRPYMIEFINLIYEMDLVYVPVCGKSFTWFCSDGLFRSRLVRFPLSHRRMEN